VRSAQLAKQHGDKLRPAVKPAGRSLRLGLHYGTLKVQARKQLEKLVEDATKSCHRGGCSEYEMVSGQLSHQHNRRAQPLVLSANLDKSDCRLFIFDLKGCDPILLRRTQDRRNHFDFPIQQSTINNE